MSSKHELIQAYISGMDAARNGADRSLWPDELNKDDALIASWLSGYDDVKMTMMAEKMGQSKA